MTGGALGLRAGSYGSLQQSQQQPAPSPIQTTPLPPARKPPKMLLPGGAREKERRLSWAFKAAGRRRVGMLLLVVASAAVLLSFTSIVGKDEDTSASPQINFDSLNHSSRTSLRYLRPPPIPVIDQKDVTDLSSKQLSAISLNETQPPPQILPPSTFPSRHPCEGFSFPPPPADRKRIGPRPCPVCYIPVEHARALIPASPSISPTLKHLDYISEENSVFSESSGGSEFGGHPSLLERDESFDVKESMTIYCGFVKGQKPGRGTGFDISDVDLLEMEQCGGIVVASAIFGNYDIMQQPKNISEAAKETACFYMFVDEETEAYIKNTSTIDSTNRVGLWRVVTVRNLPYDDARRNGKVPKLLLHRLFPNARFSIWIDGKLELVVDPYQILERFLWRQNATFAISRHYRRFDVYQEAEANKAAGKYDNASIDNQIEFYRREGLTHYTRAKLPITSDVPEGCVIIREHIPITNLFTCLWFNEVDRFTSRDQLSFSTVRDKVSAKVQWSPYMFLDCERRNFVIQAYHRDLLERRKSQPSIFHPPPNMMASDRSSPGNSMRGVPRGTSTSPPPPLEKQPIRRGRDRKSSSKRRRPKTAGT